MNDVNLSSLEIGCVFVLKRGTETKQEFQKNLREMGGKERTLATKKKECW